MRRGFAFLLFVAACGDGEGGAQPPSVVPPAPETPSIHWVKTQAPGSDLEIRVPEEWASNYTVLQDEVHFGGSGEPGRRPELIFGWEQSDQSLEEYGKEKLPRFDNSPTHKVLGKGTTHVAGMPALYSVFETGQTRQILFLFAGHRCRGFVRGIAPAADFAKYGPIFEEAARRLRYNPQ